MIAVWIIFSTKYQSREDVFTIIISTFVFCASKPLFVVLCTFLLQTEYHFNFKIRYNIKLMEQKTWRHPGRVHIDLQKIQYFK